MSSNSITKVAIVGATGRIGKPFASSLLKTGKHTVTALVRPDTNTSKLPSGLKTAAVDYDDHSTIVNALKGQDFLAITLSVFVPEDLHGKIVKAAGEAGVKWIMPNIYGSDLYNGSLAKESLYGDQSLALLKQVEDVGANWIVLTCGFWYEWSLALGEFWFGFTIKERKVTFFDDGKQRISISTWDQCGRAFAALMSLPVKGKEGETCLEDWKNKLVYINSFTVSQRDILDSLNRVLNTTDADWTISYEPTKKRYKDGLEEMGRGERTGFAKAMYSRHFYPESNSNHEQHRGLVNQQLGLPKEDFDFCTKRAVNMVEAGWNPFVPELNDIEMPESK